LYESAHLSNLYTASSVVFSSIWYIWHRDWNLWSHWSLWVAYRVGLGMVSCVVHDWLCGGLIGLETEGSSSDLLLPSDPIPHRSYSTAIHLARINRTLRDGGGSREEEK
jgi:hypothetical protein